MSNTVTTTSGIVVVSQATSNTVTVSAVGLQGAPGAAGTQGPSGSVNTASLATTGSNIFVGNQLVSGTINFGDGSTIQSVSASSGDGYGYTTLTLNPDNTLATDQQIVLDPTSPNHIHIRAGGNIDSSTAYLYLGGENNHVKVDDYGGLEISSTNTITTKTGSNAIGLSLDFQNDMYSIGDSGSVANGNKLVINNLGGEVTLSGNNNQQGVHIAHALSGRVTTIGDYADANSGTKVVINDDENTVNISGSVTITGSLNVNGTINGAYTVYDIIKLQPINPGDLPLTADPGTLLALQSFAGPTELVFYDGSTWQTIV